jgi:hypothetical protein
VELHRRLGERLEVAYGECSSEIAAELALHFEQGRDAQRAIKYLQLAAEQTAQRLANREAIGYLRRALSLVERLPKVAGVEARIILLQQRVGVRRSMGDPRGAVEERYIWACKTTRARFRVTQREHTVKPRRTCVNA